MLEQNQLLSLRHHIYIICTLYTVDSFNFREYQFPWSELNLYVVGKLFHGFDICCIKDCRKLVSLSEHINSRCTYTHEIHEKFVSNEIIGIHSITS